MMEIMDWSPAMGESFLMVKPTMRGLVLVLLMGGSLVITQVTMAQMRSACLWDIPKGYLPPVNCITI